MATSVYGPATVNPKAAFWQELSQVVGMWNYPWLIGGDFNAIRYPNGKRAGCAITPTMRAFSDWIRYHGLVDLPL